MFQEVLHVADTEMQLAACNAFVDILGRQLVPLQHYAQTFLRSIITALDNKDLGTKLILLNIKQSNI